MKPIVNKFLTILSAAAVLLSSCTKPENEKRDPKRVGGEVTATFEQPVFDNATKALDNQFHFSFENNEQINIYPQALGQCMVCALVRTSDASRAKFHVNGFDLNDADYSAVYPYLKPDVNPTKFHFSLAGQEQASSGDASHLTAYDLNYAQTKISDGEGVFAFKHVFSWLQVHIDPNRSETINELVVSAGNGIANDVKLNLITGDINAAPVSADENIILKINGDEGVNLTKGTPFVAYLAVPAGEYNDLQIVCGSYHRTIPGVTLLEAGHVKSIDMYGKLSMPVASPIASFVTKGTVITLTSAEGADIHYTLDDSDPDENSPLYTSGIEITGKCTIKAIAVKKGWTTSDVLISRYAIPAAPEPKINISRDGIVTITSELKDAVIQYTLDGRSPNESSPVYDPSSSIVLEGENITVSAIAVSPYYEGSLRATEYYLPVVTLTEEGFQQLHRRNSYTTPLLVFMGHGMYDTSDGEFRMYAGNNDYIMCKNDKRGFRYIKIQTSESDIKIKILASEDNLSVVDLYKTEPLETLTIGKEQVKFSFPEYNNYKSIAIIPGENHQCNVLNFEVGLE